jgi:5-methylcytosine-specific restriction endonuclease McrA
VPKGRAKKLCGCGRWFTLPACHADRHRSCSATCAGERRDARREEAETQRRSNCIECGTEMVPRPWQLKNGIGRFCSARCSASNYSRTDKFKQERLFAGETYKKNLAAGVFARSTGPDSPLWTGGPVAAMRRHIASGKAAESARRYRKANPDKVREWASKRSFGYAGRLPRGTVARLLKLQRNKCAFCACDVSKGFHVDHVMPLAKGGKHEPLNIQILCPTCNVRKSARHPIDYAQMHGRLL